MKCYFHTQLCKTRGRWETLCETLQYSLACADVICNFFNMMLVPLVCILNAPKMDNTLSLFMESLGKSLGEHDLKGHCL